VTERLVVPADRPLRVLLLCEAANPEWTSVPLVGWSHAMALRGITDAHIVTQVRNREAFHRAGIPPEHFTAIDSEAVARIVHRAASLLRGGPNRGWTTIQALSPLSYSYFEHLAWRQFGTRIQRGEFDLVHRITPLSPTIPSAIARHCAAAGVPFILGPLNGGIPWPRPFDRERRREREWLSYIRDGYRLVPGYRSTRRHAAAIICGSLATLQQMPPWCRHRCLYIPENGIDPARFARAEQIIASRPPPPPLRIAFVGRLVPYKGADMLIEAAAPLLRSGRALLDIIGDGPEMPRLRHLVRDLGIAHAVQLDGWVPHTSLQERLGAAHLLAFPSIREFGGGVVLEAMALGLIPVVVHYGGPGELVTADTGLRIPLAPRTQLIAAFRRALEDVLESSETPSGAADLQAMASRARQRVLTQFTWGAKARQVFEVYRWVLGDRDRPQFPELLDAPAATPVSTPASPCPVPTM
jgi:glycosyltransferase involved in cell wall biosynthesis